jgi:hypothetical protein
MRASGRSVRRREKREREERCVRIKLEGEHRVGRFEGNSNVSRPKIQTASRDAYLVLGEYGQFLLERNTCSWF